MTALVPLPAEGDLHARLADHSLAAVLAEFDDTHKVPRWWVRAARRGCPDCAAWDAVSARRSAIRRAYRHRTRRRQR